MSLIAYVKTLWQNGTTPAISATNLSKIEDGIEAVTDEVIAHEADYTTQIPYAVSTGSANTYVVATTPALTSLVAGVAITVKFNVTNTGASTLNWDTKGAVSIKNPDGTAVASGDLNGVFTLRYDGVNFILQGKGGVVLTGDAVVGDVVSGKTFYNTDPKTKLTGTLKVGKKSAVGSLTFSSNTDTILITGLDFQPTHIMGSFAGRKVSDNIYSHGSFFYSLDTNLNHLANETLTITSLLVIRNITTTALNAYPDDAIYKVTPTADGFTVKLDALIKSGFPIKYTAFGD